MCSVLNKGDHKLRWIHFLTIPYRFLYYLTDIYQCWTLLHLYLVFAYNYFVNLYMPACTYFYCIYVTLILLCMCMSSYYLFNNFIVDICSIPSISLIISCWSHEIHNVILCMHSRLSEVMQCRNSTRSIERGNIWYTVKSISHMDPTYMQGLHHSPILQHCLNLACGPGFMSNPKCSTSFPFVSVVLAVQFGHRIWYIIQLCMQRLYLYGYGVWGKETCAHNKTSYVYSSALRSYIIANES